MPDVIIIGGGLAGLTAGIELSRNDVSVLLIEKDTYPQHKVCGEYLSKEILPYLEQLEIPIGKLKVPQINQLLFSTSAGRSVKTELPLGGLGISRFALDNLLYEHALRNGVEIAGDTATSVVASGNDFIVKTGSGEFKAPFVLGAFGKRSVLDKSLNRPFFRKPAPWLAVKAHYSNPDFPDNLVALHNFNGGYCGLSRTESGAVNLCYLASYSSFKAFKNTEEFEKQVLMMNPFLLQFFRSSRMLFENSLSIAQISFERKEAVSDHILFAGDAAGLIHPLCGNGMAMAIHSAKIAAEVLLKALKQPISQRNRMEEEYQHRWNLQFRKRIKTGKLLQSLLLHQQLSNISQRLVSNFPFLLPQIIKRTHGSPIL